MAKIDQGFTRQRVVAYVIQHIDRHNYSPRAAEIAQALGLTTSNVRYHLMHAISRGELTIDRPGDYRTMGKAAK